MKPDDLEAYDRYPQLMAALLAACSRLMELPLDGMLLANSRILLTGTYIGPDASQQVDTGAGQKQRRLIEEATRFRDTLAAGL